MLNDEEVHARVRREAEEIIGTKGSIDENDVQEITACSARDQLEARLQGMDVGRRPTVARRLQQFAARLKLRRWSSRA